MKYITIILFVLLTVLVYSDDEDIKATPYILSSLFIPGSGQFLLEHKVKGSLLFATELAIIGSGLNDGIYLTTKWQNKVDEIKAELNSTLFSRDTLFMGQLVSTDSLSLEDDRRLYGGRYQYSKAMMDKTIAWAIGFHVYNVFDCYQYISDKRKVAEEKKRTPSGAFLRSLVLPGWGQLYNRRYSKFGLMVMSMVGFGSNIYVWNRVANFHGNYEDSNTKLITNAENIIERLDDNILKYNSDLKDIDSLLAIESLDSLRTLELMEEKDNIDIGLNADMAEQNSYEVNRSYLNSRKSLSHSEKVKYLSKRNQNIWYLVAIYFFGAFDALVDAHLENFDSRIDLAFIPSYDGLNLSMKMKF